MIVLGSEVRHDNHDPHTHATAEGGTWGLVSTNRFVSLRNIVHDNMGLGR